MIAAAALALLLAQDPDDVVITKQVTLPNPGDVGIARALIQIPQERRETPKISPLNRMEFPFNIFGYGNGLDPQRGHELRFRIYSQQKKAEGDVAPLVARTLLRLWDFNYQRLSLEHSPRYRRLVDVYLCWGGTPGGEQRFTVDRENDVQRPVNTIHIYDLGTFTEPLEMAREVAHEYGHAAIPPVGGFKTPEDWANGYLGEKMYLRYLRDQISSGKLGSEDAMNATAEDLDGWVKENVDPLVAFAARNGPDEKLLAKTGSKAMDSYMGLVLYSETILPAPVFARSMVVIGSTKAKDYPDAVITAVTEKRTVSFDLPATMVGRNIWLPTGAKGKVTGATVKRRSGGWTLVIPKSRSVKLTNRLM
jgi:hypothetical protein